MSEYKTNLARIMRERGITQQALADLLGVSRQAVSIWQKNGRFSSSTLPKVAAVLGVPVDALLGDEEGMQGSRIVRVISDEPLRPGYIRVPVFDATGSCGGGGAGSDIVTGALDLAEWFIRSLPGVTAASRLEVISSTGDSMAPTIEPRAMLLVDATQTRINGDGVYCLRVEGDLFVKRVQKNPGGSLTLLSDNPLYPPQQLDRMAVEQTDVLGRVVFTFNGRNI